MYSPFPTLTDVLFYTKTDGYNYLTDNRPIYQLDENIRALATSLVGVGYGEHSSVSGSVLSPGKGVELLPNGQIRYPDSTTDPKTAILGLAIGASAAGLTKVIWGAELLDLDVLGLSGILGNTTAGQIIKINTNITGALYLDSSSSDSDLVLGKVKNGTYISIGRENKSTVISDAAPQKNYANNFGVARKRNLELLSAVDSSPIQFSKAITYQDAVSTINPVAIRYNSSTGTLSSADVPTGTVYGNVSNWVIMETYTQFLTEELTPSDVVSVGSYDSSWPAVAYPTSLAGGLINYELAAVGQTGLDYSDSANLSLFKSFYITKYYQYARVTSLSDPNYGKVTATITVFDPRSIQAGGEQSRMAVCEFFTYDTAGRQVQKDRIVITGVAADILYNDETIIPAILK